MKFYECELGQTFWASVRQDNVAFYHLRKLKFNGLWNCESIDGFMRFCLGDDFEVYDSDYLVWY